MVFFAVIFRFFCAHQDLFIRIFSAGHFLKATKSVSPVGLSIQTTIYFSAQNQFL
uniref:Uncharacterized protein n=1 Tax=Rheinheimera sp. BAL341 TaxID=1708203 RepID=A0A486XJ59_9GAMM